MNTPFYDPTKSYDENYDQGPFGDFADGNVFTATAQPKFTFLGFPLNTPFGIPAGPLLNSRYVKAAFDKGFSVCVYKTVRSGAKSVNGFPNVVAVTVPANLTLEQAKQGLTVKSDYTSPLSITNSFGVPSKDPSVWQEDMRQAVNSAKDGQLMIGSFQGTTGEGGADQFISDCVHTAKLVSETGAKVLEMNTSCPNEGTSHLLCFDIDRVEQIVKAIKKEVAVPLILKVAYFEDQTQLRDFVTRIGPLVEGISTINTIPAKIFDATGNQGLPGEGRAVSGVCGDAIRWAGLEMVQKIQALRKEFNLSFALIGVGGVLSPEHVNQYRTAGADLVMSATGAMWNPHLGEQVYKYIVK